MMGMCAAPDASYVRFRFLWKADERLSTEIFLNQYFERTADWSNAVADMGLLYKSDPPYTRLAVVGDFYWDAGLRMDHFALDCSGSVILVAVDDEGKSVFKPLI